MKRWEKYLFSASVAVSALSGGAYFWLKSFWESDDPFAVVNHPLEPLALDVHVLAGPALLFIGGAVFKAHVLPKIRMGDRKGRRLGYTLIIGLALMTISGYLLQIVSTTWLRELALYCHLVSGFISPLVYVGHLSLSCRKLYRSRASDGKETRARRAA
jgi:hypothetical protein